MKVLRFSPSVLLLAICALLSAGANQSLAARDAYSSNRNGATFATSAADGGRLVITRTPVLGLNVAVTIRVDGRYAKPLMQGHIYDKPIAPGRHTLFASVNGGGSGDWSGVLDVRPGQTYSYMAHYVVNKIVLTPVAMSR